MFYFVISDGRSHIKSCTRVVKSGLPRNQLSLYFIYKDSWCAAIGPTVLSGAFTYAIIRRLPNQTLHVSVYKRQKYVTKIENCIIFIIFPPASPSPPPAMSSESHLNRIWLTGIGCTIVFCFSPPKINDSKREKK